MRTTFIWLFSLLGHMYFNGTWFDVAPRMDIKRKCVETRVGLHVQNMITMPGSIVYLFKLGGGGHI